MANRITAIAGLAGQLGRITADMGTLLVQAPGKRDHSAYFEDYF